MSTTLPTFKNLTHMKMKFISKRSGFVLASTLSLSSLSGQDVKVVFQQNCAACHKVVNDAPPIVGPSLVEINHLYRKKLPEFIQWCKLPGKKRNDAIRMPSMANLGDEQLTAIYNHIRK